MRAKRLILLASAFLFGVTRMAAQDVDALGTFTPYSLYGVGDLYNNSSAINLGMGGIGMGIRDNRFINYKNIASLTQRDTLSFMMDIGVVGRNMYLKDRNTHSAYNTGNINNFAFSFPIKNKASFIFGLTPYSSVGYKFKSVEDDVNLINKYGYISYYKYGNGNINQIFFGGAMNVIKNVSVGATAVYYFGNLTNHSNVAFSETAIRTVETGWKHKPHGWSAEFAAQASFPMPMENTTLTVGATYRMKSTLYGSQSRYAYAYDGTIKDTIMDTPVKEHLKIPGKFSTGIALSKQDKWTIGLDYERQDWSKTTFKNTPGVGFDSQTASSIKIGGEFTPSRYDIRYYYKRCSYRAGFHYDKTYVRLDGKSINQMGFTIGASFPIYRLNNSINVAVDFGQRGSKTGNLVRENYINFIVSLSLHDIWFVKPKFQ
ncbi:MAG: hypothetical protein IKZ50_06640 [Bacteroidales bacterium]|nr:hypothetical protein [Bacteroidales bacterium]